MITRKFVGCVTVLVVAIMVATLFPGSVFAGENEDFRFAKKLQADGMHEAAAEEFIRFTERYRNSTLRSSALFSAGESWMQAGRATKALEAFEKQLHDYPQGENVCKARYYRGIILKALKRYSEAVEEWLMIPDLGGCPLEGKALLEAGESLIAAGDPQGAIAVLRKVADGKVYPEQAARAGYSLAIALSSTGRDLEGYRVLEELVSRHRMSPVAALALMKLGDWSRDNGRYDEAVIYYRKAASDYKEDSLREKALMKLIETAAAAVDDMTVVDESGLYLRSFPEAERRPVVYNLGIESASRLDRHETTISLIDSWRSEGTSTDGTGRLSLLRTRILEKQGKTGDALAEIEDFKYKWPRSTLLVEALLLEGKLLSGAGRFEEAAATYNLAILEGALGEGKLEILGELASIYAEEFGDTLVALRYLDMIVETDMGGTRGEEALWLAASMREAAGDLTLASRDYRIIKERYFDGRYNSQAAESLERIELLAGSPGDPVPELSRLAVSDAPPGIRMIETGIVLIDQANMPEEAIDILERSLDSELTEENKQRAKYYLGKAESRLYEISVALGKPDETKKNAALSRWLEVAREAPGSNWSGRSHRSYLEYRLMGLKLEEQIKRLDEFLTYYKESSDYWWAVSKKFDYLYEASQGGRQWAADSALVIATPLLSGSAPEDARRDALLKTGYIYRGKGDRERALIYFTRFTDLYKEDMRLVMVWFDIGETRLAGGDIKGALEAYTACLDAGPHRTLEGRCKLRIGDCRYYMKDYSGAAAEYGSLSSLELPAGLEDEVAYRQALALMQIGKSAAADSILVSMHRDSGLARGLRIRVLDQLGRRLAGRGDFTGAKPLLEELVSLERTHSNIVILAEVELEAGDSEKAEKDFSAALKMEGADTCRILSGRARANYIKGNENRGGQDLERLLQICLDHAGVAGALLARGEMEAQKGDCEAAARTLAYLRANYSGSDESGAALYKMAVCDLRRGGNEEAIDKLNLFLRESPDSPFIDQVYFKLAAANYALGNMNLAASNYALAAEASNDPQLGYTALANLARVYQDLEDWEKASGVWRNITERFPERENIVEIFFNLGFSYSQSGRFELAQELYSRIPAIAKTEEQEGRAHYWTGISLKNLNRYDEAVREFLRVPYLKTGGMWGVTSKLEAAVCYEMLGRYDEAEKIYRQVLASHGENSQWGGMARKALEKLEGRKQQPESSEKTDPSG